MNGRYLTLAGRIRRELHDLEAAVSCCETIWEQYVHSFYTGVERIF